MSITVGLCFVLYRNGCLLCTPNKATANCTVMSAYAFIHIFVTFWFDLLTIIFTEKHFKPNPVIFCYYPHQLLSIIVFCLNLHKLIFYHWYVAEKYEYVGKLLRPGEQPTDYDLEEDEGIGSESTSAAAQGPAGDSKKSNWPYQPNISHSYDRTGQSRHMKETLTTNHVTDYRHLCLHVIKLL